MTNNSLSNYKIYTMHFTQEEYKLHQRLIYIGSVMSQLLRQSYFLETPYEQMDYHKALRQIANYLERAQTYCNLWDNLASTLNDVYEPQIKPNSSM